MKFVEAAPSRVAVSPSGKIRDGIRQGRADARFVRGVCLGKTTESDEHLFANEMGVYTTRTVKRVPDTEQKDASQNRSSSNVANTPCTRGNRTSEDADERRIAKAQDLNTSVPRVT